MKLEKVLFIPDTHVPYHDRKAFSLMLKAAKGFKPETVVILGDFADFYAVSSHSKDPARTNLLADEVSATNIALSEIDKLKPKNKIFLAGNHENRLERYIADKAPELFNVFTIPELLNLKRRGWKYVPYKEDYLLGKVYLTHDTGTAGRYTPFKNLEVYQHSVIGGHTHRLCMAVEGNAKGVAHVTATFGWLGDAKKADYMHRIRAAKDWALGFGVGYLNRKTGVIYVNPIPIVNYTCVVAGRYYSV